MIRKLNKTFKPDNVLTAAELNAITGKVDEIINSTSSLLSESDVSYTQIAPSSGDGSYKIGDLKLGNKTFSLHGKDFVGGSNSVAGKDGGYYQIAFKTTSKDTPVSEVGMPTNGVSGLDNGWSFSAENNDGTKAVWMISRYVSGTGVYDSWKGPWMISGANGKDGKDGQDGKDAELQTLNLEVLRVRSWIANPSPAYNNGTTIENGVKYIDIVEHNGNYYKCLKTGTTEVPGEPSNVADPAWTMLTGMGNAWFDTMIANNAYIKSITAKQIVVTSDATTSTEGEVPVAGMLNGTIIPTELTGKTNNNGIRIFAGNIPANGDVSDAPFTVDNQGRLKAINAEISGTLRYNQAIGNVQMISDGTGEFVLPDESYYVEISGGFGQDSSTWPIIKLPQHPVTGQTLFIYIGNGAWFLEADQTIMYYALTYDVSSSPQYNIKQQRNAVGQRICPYSVHWNGPVQFIYNGSLWQQIASNITIPQQS